MIRDHIVFNFHEEGQPLREHIDRVFAAAKFLGYEAGEQQLVDRIVMNLHPTILAHAAFLERPRFRKELNSAVSLIEDKFSALKERQKTPPAKTISSGATLVIDSRPGMSRRIPVFIGVGIVDIWVILDVIVVRRFPGRETGKCPAVTRPPGRNLKCVSQNCCGTSEYFIVGRLGLESGKGPRSC